MRFHYSDKATIEERFWAKVKFGASNECWLWLAGVDGRKYGMFSVGKRPGRKSHMMRAHRYSLELKLGRELLPDEEACHECDNPICVNPDHLFPGSHDENMKDLAAKGRTKGELHWKTKVTDSQILEMQKLRAGGVMVKDLAARFGVSEPQASRLSRGKRT